MTYDADPNPKNQQRPPVAAPAGDTRKPTGPGPLPGAGTGPLPPAGPAPAAPPPAGPSATAHARSARSLATDHADASGTARTGAGGTGHADPAAGTAESAEASLFPQGERDKLALRLQQAVNTFVDGPRRAVEEADGVFEEASRRLTEAVAERRGSLRSAWAGKDREAETEELRVALRTYREVTERLLRM
ncbi:hypothetical protein [Streptomyces chryseus]|uniref:Uncharacterized protein n=2 Tax=Streptomyces chryseus TaxID=68186 RepID=A0ABQ3DFM2_9ACTN|nr:hypothetical protein [Streptomyces chryseus]GHA86405.1 hypothetical protein GCM10010346_06260 [Streptomyces chryseus]